MRCSKYATEAERQAAWKAAKQAWYARNREAYLARQKAERRKKRGAPQKPGPKPGTVPARIDGKANPEYFRNYTRARAADLYPRTLRDYHAVRRQVLEAYGGTPPICACCGEWRYPFLSLDHIDGSGAAARKTGDRGNVFWRRLRREGYPPGYRVLCHNCNQGRGQFGKCPHELERDTQEMG